MNNTGYIYHIKNGARKLHLSNLRNNLDELLKEGEKQQLSLIEFLAFVVSEELKCRQNTARIRRIRQAGFSEIKTLEDYDCNFLPGFNKNKLDRLAELEWVEQYSNLILTGPPGTGKTHLCSALTYKAAETGYPVTAISFKELVQVLKTSSFNERSRKRVNVIKKSRVIFIDDFAYLQIGTSEAGLFFSLLTEMQNKCSFVIASNKELKRWIEVFDDKDLALATVDRLIEKCDILELTGDSYRLHNQKSIL